VITTKARSSRSGPQLGLRNNWRQFALLVAINGFVGAMVGLERAIVPLIATTDFDLASRSVALSFLISFGIAKALANLMAGRLSDGLGRKPILVTGWLIGLPVPLLIILAPTWNWIIFANVLLGINQGLCWSTTVIMKIDLVGPKQRGLAMGLNESAGYLAVSLAALLAGYLAATYNLRPAPFYPGVAFALLGLLGSVFLVKKTHKHAQRKTRLGTHPPPHVLPFAEVFRLASWKDSTLFSLSQAGMVNNLNDAMVWGLVPIILSGAGLSLKQIGTIAAVYPGVWGIGQLATGALSDHWGRKWMIVAGMWLQAAAIALFVLGRAFWPWMAGAVLLGVGTALVYPTLLAAVSDVAHPEWRATAVGVYRLWRDGGYAIGAVLSGALADLYGNAAAAWVVAVLTFLSGVVVLACMRSRLPGRVQALSGQDDKGGTR
jgi:MFS family permease